MSHRRLMVDRGDAWRNNDGGLIPANPLMVDTIGAGSTDEVASTKSVFDAIAAAVADLQSQIDEL